MDKILDLDNNAIKTMENDYTLCDLWIEKMQVGGCTTYFPISG